MLQSLNLGGDWRIRFTDYIRGKLEFATRDTTDDRRYIPATVPGEVHLDLWKAGIIADPYVGTNVLAARWVEEMVWSYRREFDAPSEALANGTRCWLDFQGLDLAATVVLNGIKVGEHANFFYPCRIDVTGKLRPARNVLAVHLDSGVHAVRDKPSEGLAGRDFQLTKRNWLRKPQCQFGWDWSQRLINVGIHKPVHLEWTTDPVRFDQLVPLAEVSPDLSQGTVRVRWFVEGLRQGAEAQKAQVRLQMLGASIDMVTDVEIKPGLNPIEATLTVPTPLLWWPVNHGMPNRYSLKATLSIDGRIVGERTTRIGFRRIVVNQDPHPDRGRYFIIEINNRPIFCKGGNFVPADMIFARLDRDRYAKLVDLALEENFNMLRVWGGGLYESDDFYDLCDEKGILVWQEFIYACARYPMTDQAFYDDAKREAVYQIRRLASHPSLIVWCGNNENEVGNWHWGYDKGVVLPDYAFFHLTLRRLMQQEDPTRYYQPSSPFSPDALPPTQDDVGDQHPWSVGFANTDFRDYRKMICRFPNEGGMLGPTALPTVRACLAGGDENIGSFAWQIHDNSIDTWGEPSYTDNIITQWLGKDIRGLSVEEYVYWGGLVQGEALREYIENFRRRMFDSSSAIFWMYNDTWPAARSWTTVDYYLRRTPAFHPVRRAMAPVSVVLAEEDGQVVVFGINESQRQFGCMLRFGLFNLAGGYPLDQRIFVELAPNASTRLASFPIAQWRDPKSSIAFAELSIPGELVARSRLMLPFYKDMTWPKAEVRVQLKDGQAIFECDQFAWGVCLDLDGDPPPAGQLLRCLSGDSISNPVDPARPAADSPRGESRLTQASIHPRPVRRERAG